MEHALKTDRISNAKSPSQTTPIEKINCYQHFHYLCTQINSKDMAQPFHTKLLLLISLKICALGFTNTLQAQPGAKIIYSFQTTPTWDAAASEYFRTEATILRHYYGGGVSYWLENRRYNFALNPGIYLLQSRSTLSGRDTTFKYSDRVFGLEVDLSFYPFNPIKPNPWLDVPPMNGPKVKWKKNFFLQMTPAVVLHHKRIDPAGEAHTGVNFKVDFGAGIQFHLFSHIGVAPIVKVGLQPGMKWSKFGEIHEAYDLSDKTLGTFFSTTIYFFYY